MFECEYIFTFLYTRNIQFLTPSGFYKYMASEFNAFQLSQQRKRYVGFQVFMSEHFYNTNVKP